MLSGHEKLLQRYMPLGYSAFDLETLIKQASFTELKQAVAAGKLPFPKVFATGQKLLKALEDSKRAKASYTIKEDGHRKDVPLEEYKAMLSRSLAPYQSEAFFKQKLKSEIQNLVTRILRDADHIASNKGLDDHWVKEALSHLRFNDRKHRKELKQMLETIKVCADRVACEP